MKPRDTEEQLQGRTRFHSRRQSFQASLSVSGKKAELDHASQLRLIPKRLRLSVGESVKFGSNKRTSLVGTKVYLQSFVIASTTFPAT